jgi:GNAT superfamily N-acetyltransferase
LKRLGTSDVAVLSRLAETEYALFRDPSHALDTPFGTFVNQPDFPARYDCNQLLDSRCPTHRAPDFFRALDRLYAGKNLSFQKISGHDQDTFAELSAPLIGGGWLLNRGQMMTFTGSPVRRINPAVKVEAVGPFDPDLERAYTEDSGELDRGFLYHRSQAARIGGQWLLAYLDSELVGTTGWFIVSGVARFRRVETFEPFRGQGVATTLIRHVQDHPAVRAADVLTIFVNDDGPVRLYEQLGFRIAGRMWEAIRFLSEKRVPAPI